MGGSERVSPGAFMPWLKRRVHPAEVEARAEAEDEDHGVLDAVVEWQRRQKAKEAGG